MGCIMERLQYIYDNLQDENETTIYEKYGNIAKRITITFISKEEFVASYYRYYIY